LLRVPLMMSPNVLEFVRMCLSWPVSSCVRVKMVARGSEKFNDQRSTELIALFYGDAQRSMTRTARLFNNQHNFWQRTERATCSDVQKFGQHGTTKDRRKNWKGNGPGISTVNEENAIAVLGVAGGSPSHQPMAHQPADRVGPRRGKVKYGFLPGEKGRNVRRIARHLELSRYTFNQSTRRCGRSTPRTNSSAASSSSSGHGL